MRKNSLAVSCLVGAMAVLALGTSADAQVRRRNLPPPVQTIPPEIESLLDDPAAVNTPSRWQRPPFPTMNDFPPRALLENQSGVVELACMATANGQVRYCKAVSETPEGYDFGHYAAAVALRGRLRAAEDNNPVRIVRLRLTMSLE